MPRDTAGDIHALRDLVRQLRFALMVAHDADIWRKARAADPAVQRIDPCSCHLCAMTAPMFDVYKDSAV